MQQTMNSDSGRVLKNPNSINKDLEDWPVKFNLLSLLLQ